MSTTCDEAREFPVIDDYGFEVGTIRISGRQPRDGEQNDTDSAGEAGPVDA